jgi:predicted aldo/keto reductase-like oxidoreductase
MAELPKRTLGRTGFEVTTLGFGAMELRGAPAGPEITESTAEQVLNAVLDAGINFIDTSIDYGRSEELMGRFIAHRVLNTSSPRNAAVCRARGWVPIIFIPPRISGPASSRVYAG